MFHNIFVSMSTTDYYPFGSEMPGRTYSSDKYKFGFNGKEKDDEMKGSGNSLDFGARMYDSRVGRWSAIDPSIQKYPYSSPYCFVLNKPIIANDPNGEYIMFRFYSQDSKAKLCNVINNYFGIDVATIDDNKLVMNKKGIDIGNLSEEQLIVYNNLKAQTEERYIGTYINVYSKSDKGQDGLNYSNIVYKDEYEKSSLDITDIANMGKFAMRDLMHTLDEQWYGQVILEQDVVIPETYNDAHIFAMTKQFEQFGNGYVNQRSTSKFGDEFVKFTYDLIDKDFQYIGTYTESLDYNNIIGVSSVNVDEKIKSDFTINFDEGGQILEDTDPDTYFQRN
jgi:RHS repeat-associated protein